MLRTTAIRVFLAVALPLVLAASAVAQAPGTRQAGWKGEIVNENDVIIVKNPREPLYEGKILDLQPELTIGGPGQLEGALSSLKDVFIDEDENIHLLDSRDADIKVFDRSGAYLRKLGGRGQGPGEMNSPIMLFRDGKTGEVGVLDYVNRRISFFVPGGGFSRHILMKDVFANKARSDSSGHLLLGTATLGVVPSRYVLKKFDAALNFVTDVASSPGPVRGDPFSPVVVWELLPDDRIAFAYPDRYRIEIYAPDCRIVRRILKDDDPVEVTAEDRERESKGLPPAVKYAPSKYHPAFRALSCDEHGRLFVLTWARAERPGERLFDIFDAEGRFLSRTAFPGGTLIWKNDKLYVITTDVEGYQSVTRYKVAWKY